MNPQFWWYVSRASGLVAWTMLCLSLVWGVLLATRILRPRDRPAWLLDLHRWFGGTTLVLVGIHLTALYADSYIQFSVVDFVVPFASDYRKIPVALGVFSLWMLIAVQVSSLAMRRIPTRWWRRVHMASYGMVVTVSLHGIFTGTDVTRPWYLVATVLLCVVPVAAIAIRIARPRGRVAPVPATPPRHSAPTAGRSR